MTDLKPKTEFIHVFWLEPDNKTPLRCRVTKVSQGTVYYRPVWGGSVVCFPLEDQAKYVKSIVGDDLFDPATEIAIENVNAVSDEISHTTWGEFCAVNADDPGMLADIRLQIKNALQLDASLFANCGGGASPHLRIWFPAQ